MTIAVEAEKRGGGLHANYCPKAKYRQPEGRKKKKKKTVRTHDKGYHAGDLYSAQRSTKSSKERRSTVDMGISRFRTECSVCASPKET